jgi:hypothetical protein
MVTAINSALAEVLRNMQADADIRPETETTPPFPPL